MTVEEAQDLLMKNFEDGSHCACCGQYVRLYRRSITTEMAYALVLIYRYFDRDNAEEWLHVANYFRDELPKEVSSPVRGGDFAKLEAWRLLERLDGVREDGSRRIGFWRITEIGKSFVEGHLSVPEHRCYYDNTHLWFLDRDEEDGRITIHDALRNRFNYERLMG